jgi:hypothetical protein
MINPYLADRIKRIIITIKIHEPGELSDGVPDKEVKTWHPLNKK